MSTPIPKGAIPVLDKGHVACIRLSANVEWEGESPSFLSFTSDLDAVGDARVSTAKAAESWDTAAKRTHDFLMREGHTSPFRGTVATFEIRAPLFVARQWWKYVVGSDHEEACRDPFLAWNEESRRYVEEEPEFYIPKVWREAPERRSQGSGGPHKYSETFTNCMRYHVNHCVAQYNSLLSQGVCAEQARLVLPAYALYTRWRWTSSQQGVMHFLSQRLAHDAQAEISDYAEAVKWFASRVWPRATETMGRPKEQGR